jgi:crotonobetainyl-CoA:carnitine CoA-transferase CaiB-like acyl-CoA transferase
MRTTVPHPLAGDVSVVASPMKFSATPIPYDVAPPTLGQHTREVLQGLLGMEPARLDALQSEGVI